MAVFVDLDDDDVDPPPQPGLFKPIWNGGTGPSHATAVKSPNDATAAEDRQDTRKEAHEIAVRETLNQNSTTEALGCYPIVMAIAADIDLNTLDNLSRTCRQIRAGLLQYRSMLIKSTLHCSNEDLPVDPEETLRYRARAGNWFYMEDTARAGSYSGKAGQCARDKVSECRRCGTVVCRNCAIKPPAPIVLRDRHRRLCNGCQKAPIGMLVRPRMGADAALDSDEMQRSICTCQSEGVWLCQPCGRGIRGHDADYQGVWKWRNQYGEVLGGLGTGIGDADRGVECARKSECFKGKYIEQETDCDAEDAREAEEYALGSTPSGQSPLALYAGSSSWSSQSSLQSLQSLSIHSSTPPPGWPDAVTASVNRRTPSPALGPGYARHEIEGIGGIVKRKRVKMVRVGACVPEYSDEKNKGEILGREVSGKVRSWCDWCSRVIPGKKDEEYARAHREREAEKASN